MEDAMKVENYFGGCPQCGKSDGYANAGRTHIFYCKAHRTRWIVGANLFSSWRYRPMTEDEQRRIYDEIGLGEFTEVEPLGEGEEVPSAGRTMMAMTRKRELKLLAAMARCFHANTGKLPANGEGSRRPLVRDVRSHCRP
jgi:hypothetical protein